MGPYAPRMRQDPDVGPRGCRRALVLRVRANLQPVSGVGVAHRTGRYRSVGFPFSSPGCWIRGWAVTLTWFGRNSTLFRGAIHAARWLHELQPIRILPVGLGFPHRVDRCRPGTTSLSPPGGRSCRRVEPQPISNNPVRLGFPHRAERFRPGRCPFSPPFCQSCRN